MVHWHRDVVLMVVVVVVIMVILLVVGGLHVIVPSALLTLLPTLLTGPPTEHTGDCSTVHNVPLQSYLLHFLPPFLSSMTCRTLS